MHPHGCAESVLNTREPVEPASTERGGGPPASAAEASRPSAEVADGAALLVDPLDLSALRTALLAIDGDAALRDRLSRLGRQRAQHFAFGPYARRLLSLYGMA